MRPSFAAVGFLALAAAPLAAIPLVVPTGTAYAEGLENQPTKPDQNVWNSGSSDTQAAPALIHAT
ncbi:hypothetical protein [Novosphingobium panipatense]|uniref:Uncharacterized protein n=1 Tax=Novosphingobium panipatense TaxID=428991 RepID=A0ABY1QRK8_9SPHN|nr:hypothetical protein [Novosphingobium panipatense]SMP78446.1 hypothetical protein SAMN06296065_11125 [Novosphingobium panipatense]